MRNKAVVKASPSKKLVRELKAENNKLLSRLAGLRSTGRPIANETCMYFSINIATNSIAALPKALSGGIFGNL